MVTATRRRTLDVEDQAGSTEVNGLNEANGKRKPESISTSNPETQRNKRRKKSAAQAVDEEVVGEGTKEETDPSTNGKHFRFDSEEPELPDTAELQEDEEKADKQEEKQDDDQNSSDDDDEAPEAVDNSTQLSKIKYEARKQERARQIEEQLKKEKRRQLDKARKLQAKTTTKRKEVPVSQPGAGSPADDLVSESSVTLQGSFTQDSRRPTLPALLPDDILSAVPAIRPPTPPAETPIISQKKPTKLRFLDRKEKAPKDVRMGDVAIRVLGGDVRKQPNTALAPKASKVGRNAKGIWLKQACSTGHVNGMRMASSGSKGFMRK